MKKVKVLLFATAFTVATVGAFASMTSVVAGTATQYKKAGDISCSPLQSSIICNDATTAACTTTINIDGDPTPVTLYDAQCNVVTGQRSN